MSYSYLDIVTRLYSENPVEYYKRLLDLDIEPGKRLEQNDIDLIDLDEIMMLNIRNNRQLRCIITVSEPMNMHSVIYIRRYTLSEKHIENLSRQFDNIRLKKNIILCIVTVNDVRVPDVITYTQTHHDTVAMASVFLNTNSMHIYNIQTSELYDREKMIDSFETLHRIEYDTNKIYIGDTVLFALGLKPVYVLEDYDESSSIKKFVAFLGITHNNLVHDPRNYFYFMGHKVILLDIEIGRKIARGLVKDYGDIIILYFKCREALKTYVQLDNKTGHFIYHKMFSTENMNIQTPEDITKYIQKKYPIDYVSEFTYDVIKVLVS